MDLSKVTAQLCTEKVPFFQHILLLKRQCFELLAKVITRVPTNFLKNANQINTTPNQSKSFLLRVISYLWQFKWICCILIQTLKTQGTNYSEFGLPVKIYSMFWTTGLRIF